MNDKLNAKLNQLVSKYQGLIIYMTIDNIDKRIIASCNNHSNDKNIVSDIKDIIKELGLNFKASIE